MNPQKQRKPKTFLTIILLLTTIAAAIYATGTYINNGETSPANWKGLNSGYQDQE